MRAKEEGGVWTGAGVIGERAPGRGRDWGRCSGTQAPPAQESPSRSQGSCVCLLSMVLEPLKLLMSINGETKVSGAWFWPWLHAGEILVIGTEVWGLGLPGESAEPASLPPRIRALKKAASWLSLVMCPPPGLTDSHILGAALGAGSCPEQTPGGGWREAGKWVLSRCLAHRGSGKPRELGLYPEDDKQLKEGGARSDGRSGGNSGLSGGETNICQDTPKAFRAGPNVMWHGTRPELFFHSGETEAQETPAHHLAVGKLLS